MNRTYNNLLRIRGSKCRKTDGKLSSIQYSPELPRSFSSCGVSCPELSRITMKNNSWALDAWREIKRNSSFTLGKRKRDPCHLEKGQFTTLPFLFFSTISVTMSVSGNVRTKKAAEGSFQGGKLCPQPISSCTVMSLSLFLYFVVVVIFFFFPLNLEIVWLWTY